VPLYAFSISCYIPGSPNTSVSFISHFLTRLSVTIGAIFSVGAIAAFVAFTIPIFIRVFCVGDRFRKGPWHLGKWSRPIGTMACAFVALMIPILCLPAVTGSDLTLTLMNWTVVVYGGPMLLVILWWIISAHKWFKGPKINVEHVIHGDTYVSDLERIESINPTRDESEGKHSPQGSFSKPRY